MPKLFQFCSVDWCLMAFFSVLQVSWSLGSSSLGGELGSLSQEWLTKLMPDCLCDEFIINSWVDHSVAEKEISCLQQAKDLCCQVGCCKLASSRLFCSELGLKNSIRLYKIKAGPWSCPSSVKRSWKGVRIETCCLVTHLAKSCLRVPQFPCL